MALTQYMCSPIMVNHFLSDVLVPVDQLSRRFTYEKAGESLPEDFDYRLPMGFPGKLRYSLEERLPQALTRIERIPVTDPDLDYALPFAADKMFNLNICDDGQPEGYGSHSASMGNGRADDTPYLERMFSETAAKTNMLTPEKLRLLLERYQGKSVQMPVHVGVDDRVYGSLAMYRREVCELLNDWREDYGAVALDEVFAEVIQAETNADIRREFRSIMKSIACVKGEFELKFNGF